jgi:hypothetical protein
LNCYLKIFFYQFNVEFLMKQFAVVALLSSLMVSGAYAGKKDEVVRPQVETVEIATKEAEKEKPAISIEAAARGDGFMTTFCSTTLATMVGGCVAGNEGAFALGGLSIVANLVSSFKNCAKSQALKSNDPEASQSPSEQYDTAFAVSQGLSALAMTAAAYFGFIAYQAGHMSGYWDGYASGREAERAFAKCASSWCSTWCLC